jgi:hypothetical protein
MNNYRVNINDLFDQDEDFLFDNAHFRALIKRIRNDYEYLVNPIFDLEEIMKSAIPKDVEKKYLEGGKNLSSQFNQGELINLFSKTFNTPSIRSRLAYDKMIEQYDAFFDQEKKQAEKRLNALVSGRQIHELIKQVIDFYDAKEKNRHRM